MEVLSGAEREVRPWQWKQEKRRKSILPARNAQCAAVWETRVGRLDPAERTKIRLSQQSSNKAVSEIENDALDRQLTKRREWSQSHRAGLKKDPRDDNPHSIV